MTAPDAARPAVNERRARVNGAPHGTIAWSEHIKAWEVYATGHSGQSAERINERGGFGIGELTHQLGHPPLTWEPDERTRFMDAAGPRGMTAALAEAGIGVLADARAEGAQAVVKAVEAAFDKAQATTPRHDRPFWAVTIRNAARAAAARVTTGDESV